MNEQNGIIVFGANGTGKTTLGRELARILDFKHIDHEEYCFEESDIPYTVTRPREIYEALILDDIEKYRSFVITACTGDFDEKITQFYKFGVYMTASFETRMQRIKQREYDKFGERVLFGGDMYEQTLKFHSFVASRSLYKIEKWSRTLTCPVIRINAEEDYKSNAAFIAEQYKKLTD